MCLPSDALLQHLPSYLGFSYLGRGVSLHGCSSKVQPLLLTLDEGYLLTAALPDLQRGIAPLGPPAPTQPRLLGRGIGPTYIYIYLMLFFNALQCTKFFFPLSICFHCSVLKFYLLFNNCTVFHRVKVAYLIKSFPQKWTFSHLLFFFLNGTWCYRTHKFDINL